MPQQSFGSSPHFEMHNDREYGLQRVVHGVASTIGLKILPRKLNLFQPSSKPSCKTLASAAAGGSTASDACIRSAKVAAPSSPTGACRLCWFDKSIRYQPIKGPP